MQVSCAPLSMPAVDDVQRTYDELSARGVEFKGPPTRQSWGTFVIMLDPDGNQFVVSAR